MSFPDVPAPHPSLYSLRIAAGYTSQAALAAAIGLTGPQYGRIETGRCETTPRVARRLARVLKVKPSVVWDALWGDVAS
jgi:DNA-binding XRE family transcriptional regulator